MALVGLGGCRNFLRFPALRSCRPFGAETLRARDRSSVQIRPATRDYRAVTTWRQCSYSGVMTTAITVRNVPEEVRDELAARASRSGRSLQEFLLNHLTEVASRPSVEEVVGRARERARLTGSGMNVASILSDRNAERR